MKKSLGLFSAFMIAVGCLSLGSVANAEGLGVAIVDVPQVVAASSEVQKLKKEQQEYYKYIQRAPKGRRYKIVNNKDGYLGAIGTIEEALYFRDLYSHLDKKDCPKPKDIDLKTDNPYIQDGLKYPIPERLILKEKTSNYGNGTIVKKGKTSYHIYRGGKGNGRHGYICACATYEEAYYIREELQKNNWNLSKLEEIRANYPKYYTKLLYFYQ